MLRHVVSSCDWGMDQLRHMFSCCDWCVECGSSMRGTAGSSLVSAGI